MSTDGERSAEDRLRDLKALHDDGLLSDTEYAEKKRLITSQESGPPDGVAPEPEAYQDRMAAHPCDMSGCSNPRLEGKHHCAEHKGLEPTAPKSDLPPLSEKTKANPGCIAIIVIVVIVLMAIGAATEDNSSSTSNDDSWNRCIANVSANNTTNTIDFAGIDRCNSLYPEP